MNHHRGHSDGESSRALSRGDESDENEDKTMPSTSSLAGSSSKAASVKPPGPPYHPVLVLPSLPKNIIFVAVGTAPPVQRAHRCHGHHQQLLTPATSPSKKCKYTAGPQIPTQMSVPKKVALRSEQAEETEAGSDSDLAFDDLVHPPKEVWTSTESARSFVVLYHPNGSSSLQMSQPKAMVEPPPSPVPPASFMFECFAKMVDAVPDED
ncbi:hypothetical protein EYR36_000344 [Pleurotus pulmonarius]|nr:hypothetical protein EYR36_000344 [Pleurotus pulmonarius]